MKSFQIQSFDSNFQSENLSSILYPEKLKDLNGITINVVFSTYACTIKFANERIHTKFSEYANMITEKMNAKLKYVEIVENYTTFKEFFEREEIEILELIKEGKLDLYIQPSYHQGTLET